MPIGGIVNNSAKVMVTDKKGEQSLENQVNNIQKSLVLHCKLDSKSKNNKEDDTKGDFQKYFSDAELKNTLAEPSEYYHEACDEVRAMRNDLKGYYGRVLTWKLPNEGFLPSFKSIRVNCIPSELVNIPKINGFEFVGFYHMVQLSNTKGLRAGAFTLAKFTKDDIPFYLLGAIYLTPNKEKEYTVKDMPQIETACPYGDDLEIKKDIDLFTTSCHNWVNQALMDKAFELSTIDDNIDCCVRSLSDVQKEAEKAAKAKLSEEEKEKKKLQKAAEKEAKKADEAKKEEEVKPTSSDDEIGNIVENLN